MASTYVNNLRLEEIGTGEQSGTWGDTTNTNLGIIGQAVAWGERAIANASTDNITIADGALDADRCLGLKLTGGGQACTVTLLPNTSSKTWFMYNATAAALTFTCGSGANVIIPAGHTKVIASDGLGSGGVVHDLLTAVNLAGTTTVDDLAVTDDLVVGDDLGVTGLVTIGETLAVTGVLTTTAATVFNGGFASNAASTITTADNLSGLIIKSTDQDANVGPTLQLNRDPGTDEAAEDALGNIIFVGKNNANEATVYANIGSNIQAVGNGIESGRFFINTIAAGTERSRMFITAAETVFNEDSVDQNFRVESNGNANMLFVDGGANSVAIGTNANGDSSGSTTILQLQQALNDTDLALRIQNNATGASTTGSIRFNNTTSTYDHATIKGGRSFLEILTVNNGNKNAIFGSSGAVFNEDSAAALDFRVESDGNANMLFVDAGNNRVGIGAAPSNPFDVNAGSGNAFIYSTGATALVAQADTAGDTLILQTTDTGAANGPNIKFRRVATGADNDGLMQLGVNGFNDTGSEETQFFRQRHFIIDASNGTEDGAFDMFNMIGGSLRSIINHDSTATIFNDNSVDIDFRIETNGTTHMLFADGANDSISIGTSTSTNDTFLRIAGAANKFSLKFNNAYGGGTAIYANNTNNQAWIYARFNTNGAQKGFIQVTTSATAYSTSGSDRRLKKNFETWEDSELSNFETLKPTKFNWNTEEDGTEKTKGFIAQDLVDAFPEAYPLDAESDRYFFNPSGMVVYLMKAMQESSEKIKSLEARITALES